MDYKNQLEAIASEHFDNMKSEINEVMELNIANPDWYMYSSIEQAEKSFINLVNNVIDWHEGVDTKKLAWVTADILANRLAVPIGDSKFYGLKEPLPYRWVDDETFQVFYSGEWQEAQSIDWDFTDVKAVGL